MFVDYVICFVYSGYSQSTSKVISHFPRTPTNHIHRREIQIQALIITFLRLQLFILRVFR